MKRLVIKISFLLLAGVILTGCYSDDYTPDVYWVNIATVENPQTQSDFFLRLDDSTLLWTAESVFSNYKPDDGQRVIANYSILSDKRSTGLYDYDIKVNDLYEVLTKGIFEITPEKEDSIGNDSIYITEMWIGSRFLNVEFYYYGYSKIHYINLVSDSLKTYDDGKIHLEFRHNANNDQPIHKRWGLVSFDISSLQSNDLDSVELVIHVNKPYQVEAQLHNLTYNYTKTNTETAGILRKSNIKNADLYIRENEVK